MNAWLIYLGPSTEGSDSSDLLIPAQITIGDRLPLKLKHEERWGRTDVTRIIVGSDPSWADFELVDAPLTVRKEHVRFYLNHETPEESDFRVMKKCSVFINGKAQPPFNWYNIEQGDEIQLSVWNFRYEYSG